MTHAAQRGIPLLPALGLAALGLLSSCAFARPSPVDVDLNFPSLETFLYSELGRIRVYDVVWNGSVGCPELLREAVAGNPSRPPAHDSGQIPICDFRSGGVSFEDVDEGPKAFVAVVLDASNTPLLAGCAIGEVYGDGPTIRVPLFMTEAYDDVTGHALSCADMAAKCERGCL